ncbi:MAG: hypothetical protein QM820_16865 [Minicystis sp.]
MSENSNIALSDVAIYGTHFINEAPKLMGASPLVDIGAVIGRVQAATDAVGAELAKAGVKRSTLRSGRVGIAAAAPAMRDVIERFHHHLGSLSGKSGVDVAAFFTGGKLGSLARLKPADLLKKADKVLRGFEVPANVTASGLSPWQNEVQAARDVLAAAIKGKGSAHGDSIVTTAALADAHERFVTLYNGVAKNLVRGVLNDLDRGDELPLYFLDLQTTGGAPKAKTAKAVPAPASPSASPASPASPASSAAPASPASPAPAGGTA